MSNFISRHLLPIWERATLIEEDLEKHMANLEALAAKIEDLIGTVAGVVKDVADLKAAKDGAATVAATDQAAVDALTSKVGAAVDALKTADASVAPAPVTPAP